jgi:hypothetical protein
MSVRLRRVILGFAALILSSPAAAPLAGEIALVRNFEVSGAMTDDRGNLAMDISGIACTPQAANGNAKCLVINDQNKAAQALTLDHDRLVIGDKVRVIGDEPAANVVGKPPENPGCSDGKGKFKDLDGEAVAFAQRFFTSSAPTAVHGVRRPRIRANFTPPASSSRGSARMTSASLVRTRPTISPASRPPFDSAKSLAGLERSARNSPRICRTTRASRTG